MDSGDHLIKTEASSLPVLVQPTRTSENLRISQLENEVAVLRHEILANRADDTRIIQELQREWQEMQRTGLHLQTRVGGLRVRMGRVEDHVDQMVLDLPGHHRWSSETGSDPDTTLAEMEDGSQPVEEWTQAQDWSHSGVDVKKEETDV